MPFRDPLPFTTSGPDLNRRFQEVALQFGSSGTGISVPVCPTSSLPVASTAMSGRVLIEDAGASTALLVVYWGTNRMRISGTTF